MVDLTLRLSICTLLLFVAFASACEAMRLLKAKKDTGDGDGTAAYDNARIVSTNPKGVPQNRMALTPEAAGATSSSKYTGVHRMIAPVDRRSYATVLVDGTNPAYDHTSVLPRSRMAVDIPRGSPKRDSSGSAVLSSLVIGGTAYSQTYEGATAVSNTDALEMVNQSTKKYARAGGIMPPTVMSSQTIVAKPGRTRHAGLSGSGALSSLVSTSKPVGSLAMVNTANSNIVLAQAGDAVAYAQSERMGN